MCRSAWERQESLPEKVSHELKDVEFYKSVLDKRTQLGKSPEQERAGKF